MKSLLRHAILAAMTAALVGGTGEWSEDAEDLVIRASQLQTTLVSQSNVGLISKASCMWE
ncbi:hypothetical protein K1T71_010843 [Dendrolimus kikuchii]|uniref:Uncharacterized protein n=1 Tax=Dendrolimus kikuchii TaxID=765133 RepID=A0ACC1CQQ7_9NEOP|nr:hypothetical protein K1T71_010843 [Dendrolimus kikuchii]